MKKLSILFLALLSAVIFSCKDNTKEPEVVTVDNTTETKEVYEVAKSDAVFIDPKVESVFQQYLKVQNALINTDAKTASFEAKNLQPMLTEIEGDEVVQKAATGIADSDDINFQRESFEHLSNGMEKILEGSLKDGSLYKQYCPMAFNNKGAYWISSGKNILNPYFGDKMLKCGRVDSEIQ